MIPISDQNTIFGGKSAGVTTFDGDVDGPQECGE